MSTDSPDTTKPQVDKSGEELADDAERLWLARLISAPDSWRHRAINAAGLLSAAAAASVAGLLLSDGSSPSSIEIPLKVAAVGYVVAVLSFLWASVTGSPPPPPGRYGAPEDYVKALRGYCQKESAPIKRLVKIGSLAAALAITATGAGAFLGSRGPNRGTEVTVIVTDPAVREALDQACPGLPELFVVRIDELTETRLQGSLLEEYCGGSLDDIDIRRDHIVLMSEN